jgi:predicted O-methyltransferase YrrM
MINADRRMIVPFYLFKVCCIIVLICPSLGRHHRNSTIIDDLKLLLKAASFVAEATQPPMPEGKSIFDVQGNIYDVMEEVKFYAHAANLDNVTVICETGFNAGHSAITFLFANPNSIYFGFDLGDMGWSSQSVKFVQYLFPTRFHYVKGRTTDTLKEANMKGHKCDLLSVDADHNNAYTDFVLGKAVSRPHAYVLADDYSQSAFIVQRDWRRAEREKLIRTVDCHPDAHYMKNGEYYKGWCLGAFVE